MNQTTGTFVLILIALGFIALGAGAFGVGPLAPLAGPMHEGALFILRGGH